MQEPLISHEAPSGAVAISADLVIDTIPDGLIVLDAGCRIQRWNKTMERLTGYRQRDVLGKPYALLDFRDAESGERLEQERHCLTAGKPDPERIREIECTLQTRHGETVIIRKYGRVLAGPDGYAVGILLVAPACCHNRPCRRTAEKSPGNCWSPHCRTARGTRPRRPAVWAWTAPPSGACSSAGQCPHEEA